MLTTTLDAVRACGPCENGWKKLLAHLGKTKADEEPLPFEVILDSNGLSDAIWCCKAAPQHDKEWRLFAVWCARQVEHLMTDERSKAALQVAERYARGDATQKELDVAADAARAADAAAWAARAADAARAARAAWAAADAAAADAAWRAAGNAAWVAADAAWVADAQTARFRAVVRGECDE